MMNSSKSWKRTAAALALGVGVFGLTACGTAAPTATGPSTHTSAAGTPVPGGTVVDGLFEEPNTLNPILGPSMTFAGMVETTMFRNLFVTLPNGKLAPDLATEIPTVANGGISSNGLTYTFHLNPNANWSNGKPVTSQDVITTWKLITNPAVTAWSTVGWSDIKNIQAITPKEFKVTLKTPFAPLLEDAFGGIPAIIPSSVFGNMAPSAVNTATFNHDPTVTDGPFLFKDWKPGASITVVANPNWYGPKPKAKSIVFKIIPNDNTLLANAQAHAINVYYFDPIEQVKQLEAISGAKVHFTTQPAWEAGTINFRDPALRSLKVRMALEMAINRQALVTQVWQGHAALSAADQPADSMAYNPNLKPYPYNPTEAKKLLSEAGWKTGANGYRYKNGQELTIIYATTAGNPWRAASERLDQYWLKQVGVNMVIHNYPANAYFGSVLPSGKGWDIGEFENGEGPDPAATMQVAWGCGQAENFGNWCNPQFDKLLAQQSSMVSNSARAKVLKQAEVILHNQLPDLWYYSPAEIDTSINLKGYRPNPFSFDTWNVYQWELVK